LDSTRREKRRACSGRQEFKLSADGSTPDSGRPIAPDLPADSGVPGQHAVEAVDWFGLTESNLESNLPSPPDSLPDPAAPVLQDPGFASVGGLRP
jgi:hypothetical protein